MKSHLNTSKTAIPIVGFDCADFSLGIGTGVHAGAALHAVDTDASELIFIFYKTIYVCIMFRQTPSAARLIFTCI